MRSFATASVPFVLAVVLGCDRTPDPAAPGDPPPFSETTELDVDAAILALRELDREHDMRRLPVRLDPSLVASLRDALGAVRTFAHPAADSVGEVYEIRPFGGLWGNARSLLVTAEVDAPALAPWREGESSTGLAGIDSLVTRYDLEVAEHYRWSSIGWDGYLLESPQPLNLAALGARFEGVSVIDHAEPNSLGGDGNDVVAERDGDAWLLTYSLQWGDCPSGCIDGHWWRFRVADDGGVEFAGSGGTPVDERTDW